VAAALADLDGLPPTGIFSPRSPAGTAGRPEVERPGPQQRRGAAATTRGPRHRPSVRPDAGTAATTQRPGRQDHGASTFTFMPHSALICDRAGRERVATLSPAHTSRSIDHGAEQPFHDRDFGRKGKVFGVATPLLRPKSRSWEGLEDPEDRSGQRGAGGAGHRPPAVPSWILRLARSTQCLKQLHGLPGTPGVCVATCSDGAAADHRVRRPKCESRGAGSAQTRRSNGTKATCEIRPREHKEARPARLRPDGPNRRRTAPRPAGSTIVGAPNAQPRRGSGRRSPA
jgi:hypothetical protein